MRCLTLSESAQWLRTQQIDGLAEDNRPCVFGSYELFCASPKQSWAQQGLARDLLAWIGEFDTALFWVTDWPFSEPDEMALISSLRRSHGESRLLIEAPGHVFASNEGDELVGWIYLMMCFGWDGYLFASPYHGSMFQTSHEAFVWLLSSYSERFSEARRIIHSYDLKIHRETPMA